MSFQLQATKHTAICNGCAAEYTLGMSDQYHLQLIDDGWLCSKKRHYCPQCAARVMFNLVPVLLQAREEFQTQYVQNPHGGDEQTCKQPGCRRVTTARSGYCKVCE